MVEASSGRGRQGSRQNEGHLPWGALQAYLEEPTAKHRDLATAHSILGISWHLLTNKTFYQDPGANYFERYNDPLREVNRLHKRIETLGYAVTLEKVAV